MGMKAHLQVSKYVSEEGKVRIPAAKILMFVLQPERLYYKPRTRILSLTSGYEY